MVPPRKKGLFVFDDYDPKLHILSLVQSGWNEWPGCWFNISARKIETLPKLSEDMIMVEARLSLKDRESLFFHYDGVNLFFDPTTDKVLRDEQTGRPIVGSFEFGQSEKPAFFAIEHSWYIRLWPWAEPHDPEHAEWLEQLRKDRRGE